jgi:integrase
MNQTKAWTRQKILSKKYGQEDVIDMAEILDVINNIHLGSVNRNFQTLRARALFALYYLTGCRVSEITKCNTLRKQKIRKQTVIEEGIKKVIYDTDDFNEPIIDRVKIDHDYMGVKKKDISLKKIHEKLCLIIRTENRKNKTRQTKRIIVPVEFEKPIMIHVSRYLKLLELDAPLFNFGVKRATQIINDTTGFNIHFIRHIRATHLITRYDFNEQTLIKFMGWTDSRPAKHYMELRDYDMLMQFYKNNGG